MASTTISLVTGEILEVGGSLEDVAKQLENATRSGTGTFAWLEGAASGERIGVKPAHVVVVRSPEHTEG